MNYIIELNEKNFEKEVSQKEILIMVDFWAKWCSPCLSISNYIKEISEELKEKIKICKAEIENNEIHVEKFKIKAIPTIIFIKNNKLIERSIGSLTKEELYKIINKYI